MFTPGSRYYLIKTSEIVRPDGKKIVYVLRRFVPQQNRFVTLLEHTVEEGDRLDVITAKYLEDPEQFWQICDANGVMRPEELTETVGRSVRITLPEGIPKITDA